MSALMYLPMGRQLGELRWYFAPLPNPLCRWAPGYANTFQPASGIVSYAQVLPEASRGAFHGTMVLRLSVVGDCTATVLRYLVLYRYGQT